MVKPSKVFQMMVIGIVVSLCYGCAQTKPGTPQNLGDLITSRLHPGMKQKEIDDAIGELKKYVISEHTMEIKTEQDIFYRYGQNYFPRTLVNTLDVGQPYKLLEYWTHYSGRNVGTLGLYFDANTQQLRGWINSPSYHYREKFLHEKLTSKLSLSYDFRSRLTKREVYALIGMPTRIIAAPREETRALYDDHYWQRDSAMSPTFENTPQLEVYEYDLGNGDKRKVFIGYTRANDKLIFFGYDHAWQEAERFTQEQENKARK